MTLPEGIVENLISVDVDEKLKFPYLKLSNDF